MKKLLLLLLVFPFMISSCSKDDNDGDEKSIKEQIVGTWILTHVNMGSGYIEIDSYFGETSATFNENGTYIGQGVYGDGTGTYSISGKTISCYVDNELFMTYKVLNISSDTAELEMNNGGTSIKIKCRKK